MVFIEIILNINRHAENHEEDEKLYAAPVCRGRELLTKKDWHVGWWWLKSQDQPVLRNFRELNPDCQT